MQVYTNPVFEKRRKGNDPKDSEMNPMCCITFSENLAAEGLTRTLRLMDQRRCCGNTAPELSAGTVTGPHPHGEQRPRGF